MKKEYTDRGFGIIEFTDDYGTKCSLQKSSAALYDAIWLGVNDAKPQRFVAGEGWSKFEVPDNVHLFTRMHLTQKQVAELLPYLQKFVDTGEIRLGK